MKNKIIEKRYAEAYLGYCRGSIGMARAIEDLKNLKRVLQENPDFEEFLYNPGIGFHEKCQVIDRVLKYGMFEFETRDMLKLLLEKGRMEYIREICEYVRVTYAHAGAVDAHLKSSYPLDLEVLQALKDGLEKRLQKKLNIYLELDPDLLGGVQIRVGNLVIDGSVKRRITELKEKLMTVEVR